MIRSFYRPCDQALEAAADGHFYLVIAHLEEAHLDYEVMTHQAKLRGELGFVWQLHRYWNEVLDECNRRLSGTEDPFPMDSYHMDGLSAMAHGPYSTAMDPPRHHPSGEAAAMLRNDPWDYDDTVSAEYLKATRHTCS